MIRYTEILTKEVMDFLYAVVLSGFGGFIATLFTRKNGKPYKILCVISEICIAIFAGMLVHWLTLALDIDQNWRAIYISLAGFSSRGVIGVLTNHFMKKLGIDQEKED